MSPSHAGQPMLRLSFASAMLAVLSGCGSQTALVSGTVSVNGQSPGPGTVIFLPVAGDVPSAVGQFGADGRYQLSTSRPDDGAAPGPYRVIVQARADADSPYGDESVVEEHAIPLRYADPEMSGLTAEVQVGTNTIDFDL